MIEGKKLPSPTAMALQMLKSDIEQSASTDEQLIKSWGIPQLFATVQSIVQIQMRQARLSGVSQMKWFVVEKYLLHVARLLYSDFTEEEIIAKWGPPDDADGRTEEECEAKNVG